MNTAHVLGIALLVGGAIPLSLRLIGVWPGVARADFIRPLQWTAGIGLALAVATGLCLFATRAVTYADNPAFQIKLVLIVLAIGAVALVHLRHGAGMAQASAAACRGHGVFSILCWVGVLISGRLIAFLGD